LIATHLQKSIRAAEADRPDVAAARAAWDQTGLDPDRLLDETGTSTNSCATEQCDELASLHSMTSIPAARSLRTTVGPAAFKKAGEVRR
jgi:hypothetical protein